MQAPPPRSNWSSLDCLTGFRDWCETRRTLRVNHLSDGRCWPGTKRVRKRGHEPAHAFTA
jgi:hypothetical protein